MDEVPLPKCAVGVGVGESLRKCFNAGEGADEEMERLLALLDKAGEPDELNGERK